MASLLNLGYLVIVQENGGYAGGYMVINTLGRPLEFRLSSAVQPNKVQQVLYGTTLVPYVCGELIGKALVEKAGVPVGLIVTTCEAALDLRLRLETPVTFLHDDERPGAVALTRGGWLSVHARHPDDRAKVRDLVDQLSGLDLSEPFGRVKDALSEARKMGVTGRAA